MIRARRHWTLLFVTVLVALLVAACGGSKSGGPSATATPTAQQRLESAAARMGALSSFHFLLTHQNGVSTILNGVTMTRAEGDFVQPDRLRAALNASFQGFPASLKLISIGSQTWITNPLQGGDHYQPLPGGLDAAAILDPKTGLLKAAREVKDPRMEGDDKIGNAEMFVATGTVDASNLQSVATDAEAGRQVPVRIWLGKSDSLIYRIRVDGPLSASEPKNIVRQIDLSQFNEKVDIQPPAIASPTATP